MSTSRAPAPRPLRTAAESDVDAVVDVINRAFAVERVFTDADRTEAAEIRDLLDRGSFLLAEDPVGSLLGCIYVEMRGERAYFGLLAIDPSAQRRGIGKLLVAAGEDFGRGRGAVQMDMRIVNLRTELVPFYRGLGYVETGTEPYEDRDGTLRRPCHFVAMSKPL